MFSPVALDIHIPAKCEPDGINLLVIGTYASPVSCCLYLCPADLSGIHLPMHKDSTASFFLQWGASML
jgi:hypothetical protein